MCVRALQFIRVVVMCLPLIMLAVSAWGQGYDIRGLWVGKAKGPIFGAEGSVNITRQQGSHITGLVEGGNFLGSARFSISGTIRGNQIVGSKDGNVFRGYVLSDGTIRGVMRAVNGEEYKVFLKRPYSYWGGGMPYGMPYGTPYGAPYGRW